MNHKKVRAQLKAEGIKPPRSNKDLEIFMKERKKDKSEDKPNLSIVPIDNKYTYIGAGATPPQLINFMGVQVFMRGELTTVTNPEVLKKIKGNPCFVKGKYPKEKLLENDEEAIKREQKIKDEHVRMEIEVQRRNRKHA